MFPDETPEDRDIVVMSRRQLINYSSTLLELKHPTTIISIRNSTEQPWSIDLGSTAHSIHRFIFDDLERGEEKFGVPITDDIAKSIWQTAKEAHIRGDHIIVQCTAGVSRSAGIAASLMRAFFDDDSHIFDNPRYVPNMSCYEAVLEQAINDKEGLTTSLK